MKKIITKVMATVVAMASIVTAGALIPTKNVSAASTNYAAKAISFALQEVGYKEGANNRNKYAEYLDSFGYYGNGVTKNGQSWCAIFVDWCFVQAYGSTNSLSMRGQYRSTNNELYSAGCYETYYLYYKPKNMTTTNPQPGDQIFLKSSGTFDRSHGHTGLVYKVDANYVYTIEGNAGSNTDSVVFNCYSKTSTKIVGYGRPSYTSATSKNKEYVTKMYNVILGRKPDQAGLTNWTNQINNGLMTPADVMWSFLNSTEFKNKNYSNEQYVRILYKIVLGRDPDTGGFNCWVGALKAGQSRRNVFLGFINSQEYKNFCFSNGWVWEKET